jgi:DNA-binding response OmpR family regulator
MIRDLAVKVLTRAGIDVITAESGLEGVRVFGENKDSTDIIILDVSMPDITGIETLQALRELSPTVPCIMSSGLVMDASEIPAGLRANLFFLQKPYRSKVLVSTVQEVAAASVAHK